MGVKVFVGRLGLEARGYLGKVKKAPIGAFSLITIELVACQIICYSFGCIFKSILTFFPIRRANFTFFFKEL